MSTKNLEGWSMVCFFHCCMHHRVIKDCFTTRGAFRQPMSLVIVRSTEVLKPEVGSSIRRIALKYDRPLGSIAVETPVIFQSDYIRLLLITTMRIPDLWNIETGNIIQCIIYILSCASLFFSLSNWHNNGPWYDNIINCTLSRGRPLGKRIRMDQSPNHSECPLIIFSYNCC